MLRKTKADFNFWKRISEPLTILTHMKSNIALKLGAALVSLMASGSAMAATSVSWLTPPNGSTYPVGTVVNPTGVASAIARTEVPIRALNFIYILPFSNPRMRGRPNSICGKGRDCDRAQQETLGRIGPVSACFPLASYAGHRPLPPASGKNAGLSGSRPA